MWLAKRNVTRSLSLLGVATGWWVAACESFGTEPGSPVIATPDADASVDKPDAETRAKRIFITTRTSDGNLVQKAKVLGTYDGGDAFQAADSLCALELPGSTSTWKAWISTPDVGAISRFQDKGPRVSTRGAPVLPALGLPPTMTIPGVDGTALNGVDGNGGDDSFVWTGTFDDGYPATSDNPRADCNGWTLGQGASTLRGAAGNPTARGAGWSASLFAHFCGIRGHLYCLED